LANAEILEPLRNLLHLVHRMCGRQQAERATAKKT
jgi:hypothetical protein